MSIARPTLRRIRLLSKIKWKADFLLWKAKIARQSKYTKTFYDVYKTYWIDPARIKKSTVPDHLRYGPDEVTIPLDEFGLILGGDQEFETTPFETLDVFQTFKERFENGQEWCTTKLYARVD